MPELKAVIFDMDDTLLDWSKRSVEWVEHEHAHLVKVYEYVAREVCTPSGDLQQFYDAVRKSARDSWDKAASVLSAPSYTDAVRDGLLAIGVPAEKINMNACMEAYDWRMIDGIEVFPDVPEVLQILATHNIHIGLITNSSVPMWLRDRELEAAGILHYFAEARYSAVDIGYIKPHPVVFEVALKRLAITPEEAVFVGDTPEADILGAQKVGMKSILRLLDHRTQDLETIKADGTARNFHEMLPLLDSWYPGWRS